MNISLSRSEYRGDGVFGTFSLSSGEVFCVTLEHSYLVYGNWTPKIPPGQYVCKRRLSPHFGYDVFEVTNVPNCTYIEIHIGNFLMDSEGCILIGENVLEQENGTKVITNSRATFDRFMRMQSGLDTFLLTVV